MKEAVHLAYFYRDRGAAFRKQILGIQFPLVRLRPWNSVAEEAVEHRKEFL